MHSSYLSRITQRSELTYQSSYYLYVHLRQFLDKLTEIQATKQHQKPERRQPLQLISTDTWDISDSLDDYGNITDLLEGSITIVEDMSNEAENKTREHFQNIVNDFGQNKKTMNPLLQEMLQEAIPLWGEDLSSFKIDTKVIVHLISLLTISLLIRLNLWWMLQFFTTTQSQNIGTSNAMQPVDPKIACKENSTARNTSIILSWNMTAHPFSESLQGWSWMRMVL